MPSTRWKSKEAKVPTRLISGTIARFTPGGCGARLYHDDGLRGRLHQPARKTSKWGANSCNSAPDTLLIENVSEQFKGIFDGHGQAPSKGLCNPCRFALSAILLYQLTHLYRFQHDQPLRVGLKAFLKAA
jgi:hypothetical protein